MSDSIFWSSDHEHFDGTEIVVEELRDATGEGVDTKYIGIIDVIEGKRFGHYGPEVTP